MTTTTTEQTTAAVLARSDEVRRATTALDRTLDAAAARAAELDDITGSRVEPVAFRLAAAEKRADAWMDSALALVAAQGAIREEGRQIGRREIEATIQPPMTRRQRHLMILAGSVGGFICSVLATLVPHLIR